ncbi:hypothetical protein AGOR_G00078720 [Albula goreensis]|uniref:Coiled-coil domain-containing protein 69 n=1 Tax=Albula goreensis TaxID=1534307 RepID=A0A8T3DPC9_9TELE|nr:hypothetical protein AGOR_G00078720 [Albula goreensis]
MGCCSSSVCRGVSKKKRKHGGRKGKEESNSLHDGIRKVPLEELGPSLEKLQEQFERQFQTLEDTLKAAGAKERRNLLQTHQQQLNTLLQNITDKVKADTTTEINALCEKKLAVSAEEHLSRTEELQKAHDQEKNTLKVEFEAGQASLQGKVNELSADLKLFNDLRQRVEESSMKRDLQRNIQAQGSPGAFWEQELESLLFVIEMKGKQLREQGRKLQQAEILVEKNLSLEDQVKQVLQQNENLEARINNYQSLIQDLSKEHERLQEALRDEARVIRKLSQEKEELLYKLLQREPGLPLHTSPVTTQPTPS